MNKINSELHISINTRENLNHITLLYGEPDYSLPEGISSLDIIKKNLTEKEYDEYCSSFFPPHTKISNELKRKIELLNMPKELHYYTLGELSNCHFFIKDHLSFYRTGTNLVDFLNTDFSNFDEYFVWFTKFFTSYIKYFEETDIKKLKLDKSYSHNQIETLAKKYYAIIKKEARKVQKIYIEFVEYIFNINNIEQLKKMNNNMRFYIYYTSHFKTLKQYICDFHNNGAFNYQIVPNDFNETDEKKLVQFFTEGTHFADVFADISVTSSNVYTILYITLFEFIEENNYIIKKCKNCGKYFITGNPKVNYCNNLFKGTQTCKDIGNQIAQRIKQENDKVYGKYRKIYSKKAMLVKRNPDIEIYKNDYENWKKEAKKFMDDIRNEKKSYDEFDKWLESNKK